MWYSLSSSKKNEQGPVLEEMTVKYSNINKQTK